MTISSPFPPFLGVFQTSLGNMGKQSSFQLMPYPHEYCTQGKFEIMFYLQSQKFARKSIKVSANFRRPKYFVQRKMSVFHFQFKNLYKFDKMTKNDKFKSFFATFKASP